MKTTTQPQDIKAMPTTDLQEKAFLAHGAIANSTHSIPTMDLWRLDQMLLELNSRGVGARERTFSDTEGTALSFLTIQKRKDKWALMEGDDLICLTVYRKGAKEVLRQLDEVIVA